MTPGEKCGLDPVIAATIKNPKIDGLGGKE
jgi:hypothetical protein